MESNENFAVSKYFVKSTDCSVNDTIQPSVLLGDIQENAEDGVIQLFSDTTKLNEHGYCWIILRMTVSMDRWPAWREHFEIRTWAQGTEKFYFDREFEIYDSSDNKIGCASSIWIVADINSHRPIIPGHVRDFEMIDFIQDTKLDLGYRSPKLPFPKDIESLGKPVISKYADYTELDRNHHVNNTRYAAWFCDAIHKFGLKPELIKEFTINYISEVKDSEKVDLYVSMSEDNKKVYVYGMKNDNEKVFVVEAIL